MTNIRTGNESKVDIVGGNGRKLGAQEEGRGGEKERSPLSFSLLSLLPDLFFPFPLLLFFLGMIYFSFFWILKHSILGALFLAIAEAILFAKGFCIYVGRMKTS